MKKRLERDEEQKVVGGVIAGIANYFHQDPVLFRIATIVLMLVTAIFPVVIAYLIAWIIMPVGGASKKADYDVVD